eukprot:CAMPEP_0203788148 /NCGR_PEP_ID=MMETSP0100_2-20121128/2666_1 /ASSEMBLY_ACC=CAM_ASM_000210 /TAXON_ID=96639 /ORGANISM=" , Strain NY0313808BC1" /LENGTH=350 /DNA_ID=CAMNT_0050690819 /DNA_START=71 /DNA_END=1120 /DNA_ORIENTATION=+
MGCSASTVHANARQLDRDICEERKSREHLVKLLLLGTGESGKSTIFKQMRILYGKGYDEKSRSQFVRIIHGNLMAGTRIILDNMEAGAFDAISQKASKFFNSYNGELVITDESAAAIKSLWEHDRFQQEFQKQKSVHLFDSYGHFAENISKCYPEWGGEEWIPSVSDVVHARVRTSGIIEEKYEIDGVDFVVIDVGGQRSERKKWIHCFERVTAIIYVAAISEYDQVLQEDKTQNRLVEAVELFDEICNSKWFQDNSIILFLNKKDVFYEKFVCRRIPLNTSGLDFFKKWKPIQWDLEDEDVAVSKAQAWIVRRFLERKKQEGMQIFHHVTCATDTKNVGTVFKACKQTI